MSQILHFIFITIRKKIIDIIESKKIIFYKI
jgi:hypothetical protein